MYTNKAYPVYGAEQYQQPAFAAEQYQPFYGVAPNNYQCPVQAAYEPVCPKPEEYCPHPTPPFMPVCPQLAEAYVPYQQTPTKLFQPKEALYKGTIFPELYRPYVPKKKC